MARQHGIVVRPQSVKHLQGRDQGLDVFRNFGGGSLRGMGGNSILRGLLGGRGNSGGINFGGGNIFRVQTRFFFDRSAVQQGMNRTLWLGLSRASMRVRQRAQRSIRRRGRARPPLAIMTANPGTALAQLVGMAPDRRTRNAIVRRMVEIQHRPSSPAGTPPYTHVPPGVMIGFRTNIYNSYDPGTHSAVAGPLPRGLQWDLPALHEQGGTLRMRRWVWVPPFTPRPGYVPLVRWYREGFPPPRARRGLWAPMNLVRRFPYPARPFMAPALQESIRRGEIEAAFANTFTTRVTA
jgi:hypothetical protein